MTPHALALREPAQSVLDAQGARLGHTRNAGDALRVLYELASSPDTAADALALLNELQVHQVELDLQQAELQRSRAEMELAWTRQFRLHDASPSAQLVLDAAGRVMECNAQALKDLGHGLEAVLGKRLSHWLAATDVPRVQDWLAQAQQQAEPVSMHLRWHVNGREPGAAVHGVCAAARANPVAPGVLLAWVREVTTD